MRLYTIYFVVIFCFSLLTSCGRVHRESNSEAKTETPVALQDDKLEIKSYSRSGDIIEELYQELVDKNPALQKLETDIEEFRSKSDELKGIFDKYNGKSSNYYSSASCRVAAITDSILKKRIVTLISNSSRLYENKTKELNSLLKLISQNGSTITDHHTALKIVLTLPLIEKYQKDNLPSRKKFKTLIKTQTDLIQQTDSLIPEN